MAIVDVDIEEAEKTAGSIAEENGVKTIAIKTDVTKPEEVNAMMEEVVNTSASWTQRSATQVSA